VYFPVLSYCVRNNDHLAFIEVGNYWTKLSVLCFLMGLLHGVRVEGFSGVSVAKFMRSKCLVCNCSQ
jgi:hypothetical protein